MPACSHSVLLATQNSSRRSGMLSARACAVGLSGFLRGHSSRVAALCVLPDGRLASGSYDRTIWQPVLRMYITPFMTARMSTRRLPPPRLAGGINGSTYAHSSSVRSLGYLK
jgi:hypothetical protein